MHLLILLLGPVFTLIANATPEERIYKDYAEKFKTAKGITKAQVTSRIDIVASCAARDFNLDRSGATKDRRYYHWTEAKFTMLKDEDTISKESWVSFFHDGNFILRRDDPFNNRLDDLPSGILGYETNRDPYPASRILITQRESKAKDEPNLWMLYHIRKEGSEVRVTLCAADLRNPVGTAFWSFSLGSTHFLQALLDDRNVRADFEKLSGPIEKAGKAGNEYLISTKESSLRVLEREKDGKKSYESTVTVKGR